MKLTREQYFRIWLAGVENIGPRRYGALIERYGSAEAVWENFGESMKWVGNAAWRSMSEARDRKKASVLLEKIAKVGADVIFKDDAGYPPWLKVLDDAPPLLYVKGQTDCSDGMCVSIVGTRAASEYGLRMTRAIAGELASTGTTVVSGFARGIDSAAHEAALDARGRTIAVFACGVDVVYPPENGALYERLLSSGGSVLSEYPPGMIPRGGQFPARNRIISGMSRGTLIVEGKWRSGAKITAGCAAEQGREVFVLPGRADEESSELPNRLARDGARIVLGAADILEDLSYPNKQCAEQTRIEQLQPDGNGAGSPAFADNDDERTRVLAAYSSGVTDADDIVERTGLDAATVNTVLTMLLIEGIIQ